MTETKRDAVKDLLGYVSTVRKQLAKMSGLVCPICRESVGVIDDDGLPLALRCPNCGHKWTEG